MKKPAILPVFKAVTSEEASSLVYNEPEKCIDLLVALSFAVCQLSARVSELEAQIAKNSSNSSKPPSSDGFKKPAPKSLADNRGTKGVISSRPLHQIPLSRIHVPITAQTARVICGESLYLDWKSAKCLICLMNPKLRLPNTRLIAKTVPAARSSRANFPQV